MFDTALDLILHFEGGYVNDPDDPGGATNFGVIQRTYDAYRKSHGLPPQSVKLIKHDEVANIYKQNYWVDGSCDKLELIDPYVALVHFDGCVNTGIGQAARILQRTIGVVPDGILGPKTLAALTVKVQENKHGFRMAHLAARLDFYIDLVVSRSIFVKFLPSWARRIQKLMERSANYE